MTRGIYFIAILIWCGTGWCLDANIKLYPVAAVFSVGGTRAPSRIDNDFTAALPSAQTGNEFAKSIRLAFPDTVAAITDENKRRTFTVSLQVARASKYLIDKKDGTLDVYLPITASIYFTNLMTGEVLFTATRTHITQGTFIRKDIETGSPKIQALYRSSFNELYGELIKEAREKFQPHTIHASVRGEWKGLAILDSGSQSGIRRGDSLQDASGVELQVISAGPTYAIASKQLGEFKPGTAFAKVTNQTLAEINRPRVLPLIERTPADLPAETILQLFSDALGSKAPISLIPVNPTFAQVLQTASANSSISQQVIYKRELPGFFLRLKVSDPVEYEIPTNLAYKTRRVYEAMALADLVDREGRVLFSGYGINRIEDEVVSGIAFNPAARREVVIKNALLDLANRFAREMKFENAQLPVISAITSEREFGLQDTHGMLTKGSNWRVYRSIGNIPGISGPVSVPTWEIRVAEVSGEKARAVLDMPIVEGAPEPAMGDVVFLDGVAGSQLITQKHFGLCPEQKLGAIEIPYYGDLAANVFAASVHVPYFSPGLAQKVNELVSSGSGFRANAAFKESGIDYCVEPVYRIDSVGSKCEDSFCRETAMVRLTYRIRTGGIATGEIKARHGLEMRVTSAGISKTASDEVRMNALKSDVIVEIIKMNSQIGAILNRENY